MKVAYADFGNTRLKVIRDHSPNEIEIFELSNIERVKDFFNKNRFERIYFSSVNNTQSDKIIDSRFVDAKRLIGNSNIDFSEISGMGFDRKIGLIAAESNYKSPLCTIDCGSAITINFLDQNKCLGGFILPGLGLRYRSLSNLDALPLIKPQLSELEIGKNTNDAILNGVLYDLVYGIKSIINNITKRRNIKLENVIITGGDAPIIKKCLSILDFSIILHEHLNLLGIKKLSETKGE